MTSQSTSGRQQIAQCANLGSCSGGNVPISVQSILKRYTVLGRRIPVPHFILCNPWYIFCSLTQITELTGSTVIDVLNEWLISSNLKIGADIIGTVSASKTFQKVWKVLIRHCWLWVRYKLYLHFTFTKSFSNYEAVSLIVDWCSR